MLKTLGDNRALVVAVVLLLAFLLLMSVQVRTPDTAARLQAGLVSLFAPAVRAGSASRYGVTGFWRNWLDLRRVRQENASLRQQLDELLLERQVLENAARENIRLRQTLELQLALELETEAARVVSVNLSPPFRVAVIDRGSEAGIGRDDPVITPEGVVGRVTAVAHGLATVQLIIDSTSGLAAVLERSRVQGMAVGRGVNELELQFVSTLMDVEVGDSVGAAGLEGIFPRGLRLGRVTSVAAGEGLQQRIRVETEVDFRRLEEVLVVTGDFEGRRRLPAGVDGR